jgi:hypothetical protein
VGGEHAIEPLAGLGSFHRHLFDLFGRFRHDFFAVRRRRAR